MSSLKLCSDCNIKKDPSEFSKNKTGYKNKCKKCYNAYQKNYYNKTKMNANKKLVNYLTYKLKNIKNQDLQRFNVSNDLTLDDLLSVYNSQNGVCIYSNSKLRPGSDVSIYKKISFDRIDNDLPHTRSNIVMCSLFMNRLRSNTLFSKFIETLNLDEVSLYPVSDPE